MGAGTRIRHATLRLSTALRLNGPAVDRFGHDDDRDCCSSSLADSLTPVPVARARLAAAARDVLG